MILMSNPCWIPSYEFLLFGLTILKRLLEAIYENSFGTTMFIKQRPRWKLQHEFYLLHTDWARSPIRGTDLACYLIALLCRSSSLLVPLESLSRFSSSVDQLVPTFSDVPLRSSLLSVRPSSYLLYGERHSSFFPGELRCPV